MNRQGIHTRAAPRLDRLQLFLGDASEAEARIYASLPHDDLPAGVQLVGELIGPYCRYAQTLPARICFADRGPGETLLAEAIVPDPCFWTPELPFMYSADLRLTTRNQTADATNDRWVTRARPLGIRRLGVWRQSIFLDAKRYVLRTVSRETFDEQDVTDRSTAIVLTDPAESLCRKASEAGILLVADVSNSSAARNARAQSLAGEFTESILCLARWPAVVVIILDAGIQIGSELRAAARNTLLAARLTGAVPAKPPPWADCILWQIDRGAPATRPDCDLPVLAYRPAESHGTIEQGRAACDRLQADLAPLGDFAGYCV